MKFEENVSLKPFSTFGIGGVARFFVTVTTIEELQDALQKCTESKLVFHILGKGSNSLFDDRGFPGVVILNKISFCENQEGEFFVGAGYSFSLLGVQTARKGFSGLEFAAGIPASVGGAIFMNAGANGKEVSETLEEVVFIHKDGKKELFSRKDLKFSYRSSSFQSLQGAIGAAKFSLTSSSTAREKQLEMIEYRTRVQPYKEKSCGCVFRNPPSGAAGALIERCGLKGMRIGGAEVSTLHANFIINHKDAKAQDVIELAYYVKRCVKKQTNVDLDLELRMIPFDENSF